MGILGITSDVVTRYKADVGDHIKELKKLKGEEAERAKALLEQQQKQNESLENQIKTLGKVAVVAAAFYAAAKVGAESYHAALEDTRLEMGATGVSIEGLRKASAGLRTEDDLMRDAIKLKAAAFKLSQRDMEDVEGAMRSLERAGMDHQKVDAAITQSLQKLSTEGLQELGIHVEKAGLSMDDAKDRGELFRRVMSALREESGKVRDVELSKAEAFAASGVEFEDAVDSMKTSLGKMVIALAPLVKKVAELVAEIAKIPNGIKGGAKYSADLAKKGANIGAHILRPFDGDDIYIEGFGDWAPGDEGTVEDSLAKQRKLTRIHELLKSGMQKQAIALMNGFAEDQYDAYIQATTDNDFFGTGGDTKEPEGKKYKGKGDRDKMAALGEAAAKKAIERTNKLVKDYTDSLVDKLEKELEASGSSSAWLDKNGNAMFARGLRENEDGSWSGAGGGFSIPTPNKQFDADVDKALKGFYGGSEWGNRLNKSTDSKLAKIFGPIEEFDLYAKGFETLAGGVGSALGAWIDGSESAGKAFQKFIGEAVKGLAVQMAIESLKHGAYAIGSLALGNPAGAALHAKAALAFGLGAAAAAVAAKEMHVGGAPSASAGARAPASSGSGAGGGKTGNTYVVVYGDPSTNLINQQAAKKLITKVMGGAGVQSN